MLTFRELQSNSRKDEILNQMIVVEQIALLRAAGFSELLDAMNDPAVFKRDGQLSVYSLARVLETSTADALEQVTKCQEKLKSI
jgi:hypothetical protein